MAGEMAHFHERLIATQQQLAEVTEKYNKMLAEGGSRCVHVGPEYVPRQAQLTDRAIIILSKEIYIFACMLRGGGGGG
jgi:hypothetical protein